MNPSGRVEIRPVGTADAGFLLRLYSSTREEELAQTGWGPAEKEAFLRMQFQAQDRFYHDIFSEAAFDLILVDGEPSGRLYVHRTPEEIRIIDIALLPEHRGRGIGGGLMRNLLGEAAASGRPVRIHVERFNPALRLYERLGFRHVEDRGVHCLMEWREGEHPSHGLKSR